MWVLAEVVCTLLYIYVMELELSLNKATRNYKFLLSEIWNYGFHTIVSLSLFYSQISLVYWKKFIKFLIDIRHTFEPERMATPLHPQHRILRALGLCESLHKCYLIFLLWAHETSYNIIIFLCITEFLNCYEVSL